jgi:hypothetical protein
MNFERLPSKPTEENQREKVLSNLAVHALESAKQNDYSEFKDVPELQNITLQKKIDWFLSNGVDPEKVRIQHAGKYGEESLPEDYVFNEMLKKPEFAPVLFNHLYSRDRTYTTEQKAQAILAIIESGKSNLVNGGDSFERIITSSGLDENQREEVSAALRANGYEDIAGRFEQYYNA